MVKVTSPFLSTAASGRFGRVLLFSKTRRDTVAGRTRRPSQPRTFQQLATRRYMTFLATAWSSLTAAEISTWATHPDAYRLSPYHAYLRENANRYKVISGSYLTPNDDDVFPSPTWPATRDTDEGDLGSYFFSNDVDDLYLSYRCMPFNDTWCTLFVYVPSADRRNIYTRLAHIELTTDTAWHRYYLPPIPSWGWRLWTCRISRTGKTSTVRYNYWTLPSS